MGFGKEYYPDGRKGIVSTQEKEEVSGRTSYAGDFKDGWMDGHGTSYHQNSGRVFVGLWEKSMMKTGVMSYLGADNTRNLFFEQYDDQRRDYGWEKQTPCSKVRV